MQIERVIRCISFFLWLFMLTTGTVRLGLGLKWLELDLALVHVIDESAANVSI